MRYVEVIFTSVGTCLCVHSFTASLGLENRLVNKEIELWVSILDIFNYWEGILLYLMYCTSGQMCAAKHVQAHSGSFMLFSFNFGLFFVNSCQFNV